jgi:6-pyruvoyltetrahydropterin/6-carboxytetrahydropterin synthase
MLHGYSLAFEIVFESNTLDGRNWLIDFGGLKSLRSRLGEMFDHKTVIAKDDPALDAFRVLHDQKIIDLRVVPRVGCESFAEEVYNEVALLVRELNGKHASGGRFHRVRVASVKCSEHGANSATFFGK